jgi:hypothetical protein
MARRKKKHAEKKEKWQREKMKHACLSSASEALMYNIIKTIKIT